MKLFSVVKEHFVIRVREFVLVQGHGVAKQEDREVPLMEATTTSEGLLIFHTFQQQLFSFLSSTLFYLFNSKIGTMLNMVVAK